MESNPYNFSYVFNDAAGGELATLKIMQKPFQDELLTVQLSDRIPEQYRIEALQDYHKLADVLEFYPEPLINKTDLQIATDSKHLEPIAHLIGNDLFARNLIPEEASREFKASLSAYEQSLPVPESEKQAPPIETLPQASIKEVGAMLFKIGVIHEPHEAINDPVKEKLALNLTPVPPAASPGKLWEI